MIFNQDFFARVQLLIIFLLILFGSPLVAQFSGYTPAESSSYNAGLFSSGVGLRDSSANLSGNPAFLATHGKNIVEAGGSSMQARNALGPVILNGGGYLTISENLGVGVRFKPVYTKFFPSDQRLVNYAGQAFLSYKLGEIFYFGLGVGPSVSVRPGGFSSYSWNVFGSLGVIYKAFTVGMLLESPGTNRFSNYLETETLKERYPERLALGLQYDVSKDFFLYGEIVRIFWERAVFSQNGLEEKPPFPVRTSMSGSIGVGYHISDTLDLLFGISKFANATEKGALDPLYGVSAGLKSEILPSVFGKGIFGSVYLQRSGIRRTIESYEEETRFGFQIHVRMDASKNDITPPNI
jgi:hypothetical protein